MDVQMPEMDGFEATHVVRGGDSGVLDPRIPIVAMTANAMNGDRERCLEAGMDGYVSKPIVPRELAFELSRWLEAGEESDSMSDSQGSVVDQSNVFDREALLGRLMGNTELFERIVGQFQKTVPSEVDELEAEFERGDLEAAVRRAHSLRGASSNIGALALAESLGRLEAFCRAGAADAAGLEMAGVRTQLERWMSSVRRPRE
jgi:CheY-like chemotaxis protein